MATSGRQTSPRPYVMSARADAVSDTRERILSAARELFSTRWYDEVTLNAIAGSAGVSHQSVLNHFGSKEGVFAALAKLIQSENEAAPVPASTAEAVQALLDRYEQMGLANARLAMQEHRADAVHETLETARRLHRTWIEHTFARFLPAAEPARRQKVAALLLATEVMAWKAIRHDYGFEAEDTAAAITALINGLEAQP
jgi:AcrR family transcriptional regulator